MRVEAVVLKHHGEVATACRRVVDALSSDQEVAGCHILKPGDHTHGGGFAAAGRAEQHKELLIGDVE